MQAVVLVGGEGTRLRPLTYGTPKPMIPVMNVPFLERTLLRLKAAGIADVILPAGYMPEAITDYFGDGSRLGIRMTYVIEEAPLGTAGAIKNVERYIDGPFFVLNGDVLTSLDLKAMLALHHDRGGLGVLHLIRVEDPSAFGCVVHDAHGLITAFVEKPPRDQAPTNEINAGTYLLEPAILDFIPAGRAVSIERETYPAVIAGPRPLYAYTTDDYWIDLGRPEHYRDSHRHIFDGRMPLGIELTERRIGGAGAATYGPGTVIGPALIGEGTRIAAGARVGPYVVLGDDCIIDEDAVVADSILWNAVHVESGASVEGAILASRCSVGSGATISSGAVVGHDVRIDPDSIVPGDARVGRDGSVQVS
jgi:NDP-sugar pyrophosphorylase family protein